MTLRALEIFLAVVERGSMRAAADGLYISQPSVSGVVADLETEFSVRLFERLGRKLYITPEGEKLAGFARRMLSLNDEIRRRMGTAESDVPLRIGATVTVGTCVIAGILRKLAGAPPQVLVDNTGTIVQKLLHNELDAALVEGQVHNEDLLVTPVIRDKLQVICRFDHPLAACGKISLDALAAQPLILREQESGTREVLDELFAAAGVPMNIAWQCNNTQAILNAVEGGFGVSLLSSRLLPPDGPLRAVPLDHPQAARHFSLVLHKDKFISHKLAAFIALCEAEA